MRLVHLPRPRRASPRRPGVENTRCLRCAAKPFAALPWHGSRIVWPAPGLRGGGGGAGGGGGGGAFFSVGMIDPRHTFGRMLWCVQVKEARATRHDKKIRACVQHAQRVCLPRNRSRASRVAALPRPPCLHRACVLSFGFDGHGRCGVCFPRQRLQSRLSAHTHARDSDMRAVYESTAVSAPQKASTQDIIDDVDGEHQLLHDVAH